jgi:hypothetical protein
MSPSPSWRLLHGIAALALFLRTEAVASSPPAPVWEHRTEGAISGGTGYPTAIRTIADGSTMVVFRENSASTVVRYGADGSLLSRTSLPVSYGAIMALDPFGAVFVTQQVTHYGPSYDFWTMKYDGVTGKGLWPAPRIFDGPGSSVPAGSYEGPTAIAMAPNGDVVISGWNGDGSGRSRWVTLRYGRKAGDLLWGPVFLGDGSRSGAPYTVSFDSAGDVLVAGADVPWSGSGADPGWTIVKYAGLSGALVWKTDRVGVPSIPMTCPGSCFTPYTAKVAVDGNRDVVLAVSSFASTTTANGNFQEWLTVKFDGASGAKLWGPVPFNGSGDYYEAPQDVALDAGGDVFVTGTASTPSRVQRVIVKYEGRSGRVVWGPVDVGAFGLAGGLGFVLDGLGNPILTGASAAYPSDQSTDWKGLKLSGRSGSPLWLRAIATEAGGVPSVISLSGDGRLVVAGNSGQVADYRARILAFAATSGNPVWGPSLVDGASRSSNLPVSLASDSEGNALVVTQDFDGSGNVRAAGATVKLDRSTGRPSWGPVRFSDALTSWPTAMAVDQRDDVFVTGYSSHGAHTDWETVKYDGATGSVLWGPATMDRNGSWDQPSGLVVDAEGNPIVVGQSETANVVTWALVKYDRASGAVLWGPVVYEPQLFDTRRQSEAMRVLTDKSGDVVVTAWTRITPERTVWVTVKYDGATGATMWEPVTYELPVYASGYPMDAAVDGNGDVVVVGVSGNGWATFKYSGRTGTVVWGPVGRTRNSGRPRQVIIDRNNDAFVIGEESLLRPGFAVIKYGGGTGDSLWAAVENPGTLPSEAKALISLDPTGNPIVLASSSNGIDNDWATTKYSAATGQPLWGPMTYDGGEYEVPVALASAGFDFVVIAGQSGTSLTVRFSENLGVQTLSHQIALSYCGETYLQSLTASNGLPPYSWALIEGALPAGLMLRPSGEIVGEPLQEGTFPITIRLTDSSGNSATRDFQLEVLEGGDRPRILVAPAPICPSGYSLALDQSYTSYSWLPDGQTSPEIAVCPEEPSLYGVVATDARGCAHRTSVELAPGALPARQPIIRPVRPRPPAVPRTR